MGAIDEGGTGGIIMELLLAREKPLGEDSGEPSGKNQEIK